MRFACEQCQTKYSIPDDRVRGKILKIRCKNCGCLISVSEGGVRTARPAEQSQSGGMAGLGSEGPNEGGDSTMIGGMADFFGKGFPQAEADDWHLSIDGNQNGPMPLVDLTQRIIEQAGSSAELFIWRDGFDGWKAVDAVPEVQAAVEKARGAAPKSGAQPQAKPAAPAAAPPAALASLESDNGGDATQIGSLNLPLDLGKPDDDVQDASMLSLDADAFEAMIESGAMPKPKAATPPKAPPPFKAPPPKPGGPSAKPVTPPAKPATPPAKPALPPAKPAAPGASGPTGKPPAPLFKTLPHPGLRPAQPEPTPAAPPAPAPTPAPAPAPAPTPPPEVAAPVQVAPQVESVPNLGALMPTPAPVSQPPQSSPPLPMSAPPNPMDGGLPSGAPSFNQPDFGAPSSESPAPSRSVLPMLLVIGVVVAALGGGGYWFLTRPGRPLGPRIETAASAVDAGTPADAGTPDAGTKTAGTGKGEEKPGKKSDIEGLDEATFKSLLESGEKALGKCYGKALKKDSALSGTKLKVEVEVSGKGKASEVNVEGDGDKLGKCLEKAIKKWKFAKGEGKKPYKVRFPLTVAKD